MLAQTWPPIDFWLTADDRMIATAIEVLEDQRAQIAEMSGESTDE